MPLYEYTCADCQHPFEELVMGREKPHCPACRSAKIEKRFSTFAVGKASLRQAPQGCGTCGDPRGPGACARPD